MTMFGTVAQDNYDGLNIPTLDPAKYEGVVLESVVCERLVKQTGEEGKWAIKFTFKTTDGQRHQHTEYELGTADGAEFAKKWANQQKRVGHIVSKFIADKNALTNPNLATWDAYGTFVVGLLKQVPNYNTIPLDILVVGNVYKGKATSGFAGYPPFIANAGKPLDFDNNGKAANEAFYKHREAQNNPTPDAASTNTFSTQQNGPKSDF